MKLKRLMFFTISLVLLANICTYAQENGIVYTEFNPQLCMSNQSDDFLSQKTYLDFDNDGTNDLILSFTIDYHTHLIMMTPLNGWKVRTLYLFNNDTLVPDAPNGWYSLTSAMATYNEEYYQTWGAYKTVDDKNYYAWFHLYGTDHFDNGDQIINLCIDKMAYCTIPNYPLAWGQTSMTSIGENEEAPSFATLHPNPTTGLVAITGANLKAAEVHTILGQRVATAIGRGEQLQINLSSLPAGVYLVNVTDSEGRKCVRKVVKE